MIILKNTIQFVCGLHSRRENRKKRYNNIESDKYFKRSNYRYMFYKVEEKIEAQASTKI